MSTHNANDKERTDHDRPTRLDLVWAIAHEALAELRRLGTAPDRPRPAHATPLPHERDLPLVTDGGTDTSPSGETIRDGETGGPLEEPATPEPPDHPGEELIIVRPPQTPTAPPTWFLSKQGHDGAWISGHPDDFATLEAWQ